MRGKGRDRWSEDGEVRRGHGGHAGQPTTAIDLAVRTDELEGRRTARTTRTEGCGGGRRGDGRAEEEKGRGRVW